MKSRFFTDTQALDAAPPPCDKVCVCLLMNRQAYERAVHNAARMRMTSGEYIDRLVMSDRISACGTRARPPSDSPLPCFPPAQPGR